MALGQDVTDAERAEAEAKGEQPRPALPALTATRLEKGYVVRVGLTDWVKRAEDGPRGRARSRATSSTCCGGSSRACAPATGEDPELRHPQPQRRDVEVGASPGTSAPRASAAAVCSSS